MYGLCEVFLSDAFRSLKLFQWSLTIRDVHYGTFRGFGIFISNSEYQILFRNNLLGAKQLIAQV